MIKNYFKIAFRNLWRNKAFSVINIFGLAIGIATCLIITLFVKNELSYDRYNKKAGQIVRVVFRANIDGQKINEANVMPPVAKTLLADYPEVKKATRIKTGGQQFVSYGDKSFEENSFAFVDPDFFEVFTLPLIEGDAATALQQPNTIVITKAIAEKYFGNEDPLGKALKIKGAPTDFTVSGVINKVPDNSHFHFDFFASMENVPDAKSASFMTSSYYTYLVLAKGYNYKKLQAKLPEYMDKYMGPQFEKGFGMTLSEYRKKGNNIGLYLQPLTDIHLHSDFTNDLSPEGDIRYVYIFSAIALFMLLIACINFMNLSTASASKRAREVGIRKVLGSLRSDLIRQFLTESIVLTAFALILAIVFVNLALPFFNQLSGKELSFNLSKNPWIAPALFTIVIITGVFAGSYPAFFLSSFKPVTVLKGKITTVKKTIGIRSGLVVFQFFISIVLIIATTVVYRQLVYIQHIKLGYDKSQVILLPQTYMLQNNQQAFYNKLKQDQRVENVSISGYIPAGSSYGNNFFIYPGNDVTDVVKTLRYDVDYNYLETLGMKMAYGRYFSDKFGTDSSAIILNQTAARALGWDKDALNKIVSRKDNSGKLTSYHVIGVVKDFHFKSMHEPIAPLVMVLGNGATSMIVKAKTKDVAGLLSAMKKTWASLSPEGPMNYSFLDERVQQTYAAEQKMGTLLAIFAGLTIFIACLGLFGLVTFSAEQRTKEIGIRKVLGASVTGIVELLSKDFLKLVLVAIVIATPVAWFAMNKWLQDFAYRIYISWWFFVIAGGIAILIALITITFQAIKAALANPVESLRSE
ncbi:MAG: ABC transporter permease [Bacteroidota bacterium]|nr:ABC transporter permease [Bacteroidota bacterium]